MNNVDHLASSIMNQKRKMVECLISHLKTLLQEEIILQGKHGQTIQKYIKTCLPHIQTDNVDVYDSGNGFIKAMIANVIVKI